MVVGQQETKELKSKGSCRKQSFLMQNLHIKCKILLTIMIHVVQVRDVPDSINKKSLVLSQNIFKKLKHVSAFVCKSVKNIFIN